MSHTTRVGWGLTLVGLMVWTVGCAKEAPPAAPATTGTEEPAAVPPPDTPTTEGAATPSEGDQTEANAIQASLASLSAEDRDKATQQKICPVSEEPLGAMGAPIKVSVAGHDVFICCESCEEPLKSDPAKHLAKINLTPAADGAVQ